MSELATFAVVATIGAVALVGGIGLGILVARRLTRLMDREEEPGDD
jgi:hypothetical protein